MIIRRATQEDYKALMALYTDFIERDYSNLDNDSFQKVIASENNYHKFYEKNGYKKSGYYFLKIL